MFDAGVSTFTGSWVDRQVVRVVHHAPADVLMLPSAANCACTPGGKHLVLQHWRTPSLRTG